jgi:hypothetical protein
MPVYQVHKRVRVAWCLAIFAVGISAGFAQDETDRTKAEKNQGSATLASLERTAAKHTIAYQLRDWKGMHFHDAALAQKHLDTVKQLGCVAKSGQHSGHIDVKYHCQEWKSISVDGADKAQQWQTWLVSAGFDVFCQQVDPSFSQGAEGIEFRLADWKTIHGDGSPEQTQFIDTLRKMGCDVRVVEHNGHSDVRFRAPIWCVIRVADQAAANQWMDWFKAQSFEARLATKN